MEWEGLAEGGRPPFWTFPAATAGDVEFLERSGQHPARDRVVERAVVYAARSSPGWEVLEPADVAALVVDPVVRAYVRWRPTEVRNSWLPRFICLLAAERGVLPAALRVVSLKIWWGTFVLAMANTEPEGDEGVLMWFSAPAVAALAPQVVLPAANFPWPCGNEMVNQHRGAAPLRKTGARGLHRGQHVTWRHEWSNSREENLLQARLVADVHDEQVALFGSWDTTGRLEGGGVDRLFAVARGYGGFVHVQTRGWDAYAVVVGDVARRKYMAREEMGALLRVARRVHAVRDLVAMLIGEWAVLPPFLMKTPHGWFAKCLVSGSSIAMRPAGVPGAPIPETWRDTRAPCVHAPGFLHIDHRERHNVDFRALPLVQVGWHNQLARPTLWRPTDPSWVGAFDDERRRWALAVQVHSLLLACGDDVVHPGTKTAMYLHRGVGARPLLRALQRSLRHGSLRAQHHGSLLALVLACVASFRVAVEQFLLGLASAAQHADARASSVAEEILRHGVPPRPWPPHEATPDAAGTWGAQAWATRAAVGSWEDKCWGVGRRPNKRCGRRPRRRCATCLTGFYCSRRCQKADWNRGGHDLFCPMWRALLTGNRRAWADFVMRFDRVG